MAFLIMSDSCAFASIGKTVHIPIKVDTAKSCGEEEKLMDSDLPAFGSIQRCPKCNYEGLGTEYSGLRDCLIRTCSRCGYRWDEATAEKKPPVEQPKRKLLVE